MADEKMDSTSSPQVQIPEKLTKIVKEIEEMKLVDLAELVKVLEKKFGVSAAPQVVAAAPSAGVPAAVEDEKKFFNIILTDAGAKKIDVIKVVKDSTQKGLKDCKDLVDAVANGPQVIKENVKKEEAEAIKKQLEAVGAKAELK